MTQNAAILSKSFEQLADAFVERLTNAVAETVGKLLSRVDTTPPIEKLVQRMGSGNAKMKLVCRVPGCLNTAGPRNRYICVDHVKQLTRREQNAVLKAFRAKYTNGNGASAYTAHAPAAKARKGPPKGRKLDMRCRVEKCPNTSKGPRFHFICERHLKELPPKDQRAAVEAWKEKHG